jgi:hypothetical protein
MGSKHLFDATEIFSQLSHHKKINLVKLGFYMVLFFVFLYRYGFVSGVCLRVKNFYPSRFVLSLVQGSFKRKMYE